MFCFKCGKEIANGSKFCPYCGAVTSGGSAFTGSGQAAGSAGTAVPGPSGLEQGGKKGSGKGVVIGVAAAAVVVIAAVVLALSGLFSSPKGQVEKALVKSAAAYADAGKSVGLPDLSELAKNRSMTQRWSVELNSINRDLTGYDLSSLKGLGVRLTSDVDQKGRKMDFEAAAYWDGEDIATVQLLADGARISAASPEFTKGQFYGVNTETLGEDLDRLGVEDGSVDVKSISFNIFELMEAFVPGEEQTREMEELVKQAGKDLLDATEVTKTGKQSLQVNGKNVDATAYRVVVPEGAMKDYINAMEDAMKLADNRDAVKQTLQAMGVPKDEISQIMSEMKSSDPYGELADTLKQGVKELGDLELDVYVSGGCVSAVLYEKRIDGQKLEIGLYLGGGENYVDNLSLEINAGGEKLTVESNGDHVGKSGVFTDETTVRVGSDRITSELRYEPKADKGNFAWGVKVANTASLEMEGQLTAGRDSIQLTLDDVSVKAAGVKVCSLGMSCYVGPCKGMTVSASSPKMLADMDEDDLMDLYYDIQDNAGDWVYDMMDRIPSDLLWFLF